MLPSRFVSTQSTAMRKSRLEGKPSMLPKPRRPGSTDRLSVEARRPSTTGHRSSSAEPRSTFGGGRLSREASATKLPLSGRSRSQQGDRYGQSSITPLRSSQYSIRPTTPRTPSEDRTNRSWQMSLDRALAFVTIKDQRQVSQANWQRAEMSRVQEALNMRGGGVLIRPLTIARFVDIVGAFLAALLPNQQAKLNNDNYITKLPHLSKRLLYPGTVSKSWLKTVNTLHAFPQALALIAYLLDLVNHVEIPVLDDWLYKGKDERSRLRREYLYKCWVRFQDPTHDFEDLNEEYLQNLMELLGNDEEKIIELQHVIRKYTETLDDPAEVAAREDEVRRAARRDGLIGALRAERAARRELHALATRHSAGRRDLADELHRLDLEIERTTAESQRLKHEVETQLISVAERTRLLDEVDYANRVLDSKRALAEQITKMVLSKETELALWQKKTLDSCVEYKQGLIHLTAQLPDLAGLAVDEKELMGAECATWVSRAVEALRECSASLAERRAEHARSKTALARKRAALLEETRSKIAEIKSQLQRTQQALETDVAGESTETAQWSVELADMRARRDELARAQREYDAGDRELAYWEAQENQWRTKLSSLSEYIETQRVETQRLLQEACAKRVALVLENIKMLKEKLVVN